jgi:organic radical activating enzyme
MHAISTVQYCTQRIARTSKVTSDFLHDQQLLEFISGIPPTHIFLSGGEPLIHPGIDEFIILASKCGHKISLDTNLAIPIKKLETLLSQWDPDCFGHVNISQHIVCGITLEYILPRVRLLKDAGIRNFVKYIGVPGIYPL